MKNGLKSKNLKRYASGVAVLTVLFTGTMTPKIMANDNNISSKITDQEVVKLIENQTDEGSKCTADIEFELVNLDSNAEPEIIAKSINGENIGSFYIFKKVAGEYKLVTAKDWKVSSWNITEPIEINDTKVFNTTLSTGGTGVQSIISKLWYIDNEGNFKDALEILLQDRKVFEDNYLLKMGSYQFNKDNNLLYVWSSDYTYDIDAITLKEVKNIESKVYRFDETQFVLTPNKCTAGNTIKQESYEITVPSDWSVKKLPGESLAFVKDNREIGGMQILTYDENEPIAQLYPNHSDIKYSKDVEGLNSAIQAEMIITPPAAAMSDRYEKQLHIYMIMKENGIAYDLWFDSSLIEEKTVKEIAHSLDILNN